ncbi:MAG: LamG-like jellyroll fold domain-containing protein [Verrucomicrobiota bacterium]|nr:LamG-like jellyroll fold domain-containing protein [Verrucomicrobiota bacterium]
MTQSKILQKIFLTNLILSTVFVLGSVPKTQALELLTYWDFNDPNDPTSVADVTGNSPDLTLNGNASYTEDAGGLSDSAGDYALDLGGVNDGSYGQTIEGDHLNSAFDNNAMSVVFWQNTTQIGNTSAFWIHSPDATGNQRGFQAHTPWSNGTIYFDQSGCCGATQRLTVGGLVQLDTWQHFVFQRDADGNMEIWVDGVQAASQGGAEPLDPFNGVITVGGDLNGNNSLAGRIDVFGIFNEPLDEDQIATLAGGASPMALIDTSDDDEDGLPDIWEESLVDNLEDLNGNAAGPGPGSGTGDFDGDGLTDLDEYEETKTNPIVADTDKDGLLDGVETNTGTYVSATNTGTDPKNADSDGDKLLDGVETNTGELVDEENTGTDPNNADTDGDGYTDGGEVAGGTDPHDPNSKGAIPAPFLYVDFEDNATDLSGNDYNGEINGDVSFDIEGAPNGPTPFTGASFNGGFLDFFDIDMNSMIRDFEDGSYTFTCWLAPVGSAGGEGFMWGQTNQGIHNGIRNGGFLHSAHWGADWNAATVLEAEQWVHAAWVYDGATDTATIYLDGELDGGPQAQRAPNGGGTFIFGARNNGDVPYNGYVDDVTIWREVLPAATIKTLAEGASPIGATQDDQDGDGLPDAWEEKYGVDDPEGDDDNDGLTNIEELEARTKPDTADTDEDGLSDKQELVDTKTNPRSADTDKDGLLDGVETNTGVFVSVNNTGTDPLKEDTDEDGYSDYKESIDSLSDPNDPNSVPPQPEIKLLAYWDFNDPSDPKSATDVSGNAPAAAFTGAAKYSDDGGGFSGEIGDYSLDLGSVGDGSAAQTPEGPHLDEASDSNQMSVAFWQNTTQVGNTSAFWINAPAATGGQRGFQAHTPWGNGTIYFDQSGCCGASQRLTVGGQVITNQWQHFVFQRDEDGNMQIWVDGELRAEQGGAEPFDPFNGIITIGADANTNNSMATRIDEFAIYNRPLDEAEIQSLYEGNLAIDLITPPAPFTITDVERDDDGQVTLTFNARPNVIYAVDVSEDCELWQEIDDNVVGSKGKATFVDISGFGDQKALFYRVRIID